MSKCKILQLKLQYAITHRSDEVVRTSLTPSREFAAAKVAVPLSGIGDATVSTYTLETSSRYSFFFSIFQEVFKMKSPNFEKKGISQNTLERSINNYATMNGR